MKIDFVLSTILALTTSSIAAETKDKAIRIIGATLKCTSTLLPSLLALKPSNTNLVASTKGFYLHLADSICLFTCSEDPSLLAYSQYAKIIESIRQEISVATITDSCGKSCPKTYQTVPDSDEKSQRNHKTATMPPAPSNSGTRETPFSLVLVIKHE
ncbi:hypothetical protein EJ08DRAFT_732272 [Tothia fuscella]|uniref:Uncharacterized protein n=1 Tax=Tothia fuscella TaxID=1048955 RepID=A0A9P4NW53_9PEZI|nr:hypothetical protein EJ08DRAFT_732272 [Tothia fuscella]